MTLLFLAGAISDTAHTNGILVWQQINPANIFQMAKADLEILKPQKDMKLLGGY